MSASAKVLPAGWNAKQAADKVLAGLVTVTAPQVKGAHDADMAIGNERAFVVYEANDVRPGESPAWPYIYAALSIVNLKTWQVEKVISFAKSDQVFANETLPAGACFVPRILQKDAQTLRCFFASEAPGQRQSQMWYIDFDSTRLAFDNRIQRGNANYTFTTSTDGQNWTGGEQRDFVPNGTSSKPTFDRIGDIYYLGWQDATRIQGVFRSGWFCVTQGESDASRKECIMFGKLEDKDN